MKCSFSFFFFVVEKEKCIHFSKLQFPCLETKPLSYTYSHTQNTERKISMSNDAIEPCLSWRQPQSENGKSQRFSINRAEWFSTQYTFILCV